MRRLRRYLKMLRAALPILFVWALSAGTIQAQEAHSMLWKISAPHLPQPSYLLGTMHLICGEDFEIPAKLRNVLKKVRTVTFEADITNTEGSEKLMELMQPVPGILEQAKPGQRATLDSLLKEHELTSGILDQLSPFALTSVLTAKAFNCADPSRVKMMEKELYNLAEEDTLLTDHLESVAFQISLIRSMNTIDELINTLKEIKEAPYYLKDLVQVYKKEDLPQLNRLMNDPKFMNTVQQTRLLKERNNNWVQILPGKMKKGATLFAVGAGHLGGDDGLIRLLQNKGYTVTPVFE